MPTAVNAETPDLTSIVAIFTLVTVLAVILVLNTLAHAVASTSPCNARLHPSTPAVPHVQQLHQQQQQQQFQCEAWSSEFQLMIRLKLVRCNIFVPYILSI